MGTKKINPAFGTRLAELRRERGLSQPVLATLSGVPVGSLRELEQGRREPLFSTLLALARALKVTLDVFPAPLEHERQSGGGSDGRTRPPVPPTLTTDPEEGHVQLLEMRGEAALDELIGRACGRLLRMTRLMLRRYPMLRTEATPDDVLQQSLIRLVETLRTGIRPKSSRHFYQTASLLIRRELVDMSRQYRGRDGQRPKQLTNQGSAVGEDAPLVGDEEGEGEPISLEEWAGFHEAAARMPEEEREVFDLVYYQGLNQKEVAGLLGVTLRTVKRRWQSARIRLSEALREKESR